MRLQYKVVTTYKPGEGKTGKSISFPKLTGSTQMNLREVSKIMSSRSTLSGADITGVISSLIDLIPELLMNGYTIKLDGLGTFRLHAKVTPLEDPNEVNDHQITGLRITFRPDKLMKDELHTRGITKMKKKK
jgi:predicted histone-like DNA-binding protein